MTGYTTDVLAWLDKFVTHQVRLRNLLSTLAAVLATRMEGELLMDLGECMTDVGEDIIELMGILSEYA